MSGYSATTFPFVEMVLYHGLDVTGLIEVSQTSNTGPWTELRLTTAKTVEDALAEWTTLAEAAFSPDTFDFVWFDDAGTLAVEFASDTEFWVRLPPTLADLLGMSTEVKHGALSGGLYRFLNDSAPLGVVQLAAIGRTMPRTVEVAELDEHRMGRVDAYAHSRRREVTIELFVPEDDAETLLESPIVSGHAAFYCVTNGDPTEEFGEDALCGGILVYPVETPSIEASEGTGNDVVVTVRGTLEGG